MASSKGIYRILVADDDAQIASYVKAALLRDGHFAAVCRNGAEVLKALETGTYHVLILDNQMPRKTGVEVLFELREKGDDVPLVLMSSFLSDETRASCENLERTAFLQKPFGLDELRAAISRVADDVKI